MIAGALHGRGALPARWLAELDPPVAKTCEAQARALLRLAPISGAAGCARGAPPYAH
jgi:hypothetical protein